MGERTMAIDPAAELADLRHDIYSKCTNLKAAAARLRGESTEAELELLKLMSEQARSLADSLAAYETGRRGDRRK